MNAGQSLGRQSSRLLNLLSIGSLPTMALLSLILFMITEGGQRKFGIAIFGILILIPIGALVSFTCSINRRIQLSKQDVWPDWLPRSMPILFLLTFILVAITTVSLMALGDILGFYGIVAAWLVLWVGISLVVTG